MYICGIDGGGTKTKIVIANLNAEEIDSIIVGPSSIDTVSIDESIDIINYGIEVMMTNNNLQGKIVSLFAGLGGISSSKDIEIVNSKLKQNMYLSEKAIVNCANDVENAWYSGCDGRASITLIVGTGSVAYGVDEKGKAWRAGGISFLEGDYGSSYDLALRSLKYLAKVFDNRIESTPYMEYLKEELSIKSLKDLILVFEKYVSKRTELANYAKLVTKWAIKGDKIALRIVDEGARELVSMVKTVDRNIELLNKEVSIIGTLGNFNSPYKTEIYKKIREYNHKFLIHENEVCPSIGAVKLAKYYLNNH